ncbi:helix-turn-helix domain-containing protein [Lihuaxuella thermophila]|nr:helix-turn-helix domain-containing protein [Lihuaxuella thermophila]
MRIGYKIRKLRSEAGLTQSQLAEGIVSRSYLSQIEQGQVEPSYNLLVKLARRLNTSVEKLSDPPLDRDFLPIQVQKAIKQAENHVERGEYEKAAKFLERSWFQSPDDLDPAQKGILRWIQGKIHEKKHDFSKAVSYYSESVSCLEMIYPNEILVRSLVSLGKVYSKMDQDEMSLQVLQKAYRLLISEQITGPVQISLLINLGMVHGKLGEHVSAVYFLTEAMKLNETTDSYFKAGRIYMALGVCYMELNRFQESIDAFEKAVYAFKLTNDQENEAGTYTNLGILFLRNQNYDPSVMYFKRAIHLYQQMGYLRLKRNTMMKLAQTHFYHGDFEAAAKECEAIFAENQGETEILRRAYELMGDIEFQRKNFTLSLNYYDRSLSCAKEGTSNRENHHLIIKKAKIYYQTGKYEQASILIDQLN